MRSGCHGGMISARLIARDASRADREHLGDKLGAAYIASRVGQQGIQQRPEGFRLPHDGLAMQAVGDEVVHGLDVVLFETIPGRAEFVALLRGQARPSAASSLMRSLISARRLRSLLAGGTSEPASRE